VLYGGRCSRRAPGHQCKVQLAAASWFARGLVLLREGPGATWAIAVGFDSGLTASRSNGASCRGTRGLGEGGGFQVASGRSGIQQIDLASLRSSYTVQRRACPAQSRSRLPEGKQVSMVVESGQGRSRYEGCLGSLR
jgi:hypothetical protein